MKNRKCLGTWNCEHIVYMMRYTKLKSKYYARKDMAVACPHGRARAGFYPGGLRDELGGASRAERGCLRGGVA